MKKILILILLSCGTLSAFGTTTETEGTISPSKAPAVDNWPTEGQWNQQRMEDPAEEVTEEDFSPREHDLDNEEDYE